MNQLLDHPVPTLPPPPRRENSRFIFSRRIWRIILLVVSALFVFGMWLFYFSSVFALQSIVVEGVRLVPPAEVGQRADLGTGTPLARINPDDVQERVMRIPEVSSVQVFRRWPDSIVIKVVERRQVGYVKETTTVTPTPTGGEQEGGANGDPSQAAASEEKTVYRILDETGYAFRQVDTLDEVPPGIPVIDAADEASQIAAAQAVGAMSPQLLKQITLVTAKSPTEIILKTDGQATVLWGKSEQNDVKARILAILLKKTDDLWIDVRYPEMPTTAYSSPQPVVPSPTPTTTESDGQSGGESQPQSTTGGQETQSVPSLPGVVPSTLSPSTE